MAQLLLFLFLAIVAPVWDLYDTQWLKKHPGSAQKIRYYKTTAAWLWIASAVAVLIVGWEGVFTITPAPDDAAWLFGHLWVRYLGGTLIALFVALSLQPFVTVVLKKLKKKPRTYRTADTMKSLDYFLPATWTERRWWAFISITAAFARRLCTGDSWCTTCTGRSR